MTVHLYPLLSPFTAPHRQTTITIRTRLPALVLYLHVPALTSATAARRESMDPITELLSQLSGVRRAATLVSGGPSVGAIGSGTASRLQQLQVSAPPSTPASQEGRKERTVGARRWGKTAGGFSYGIILFVMSTSIFT